MAQEFEGQRVTVMGLGRFGGGVGVTRFLCGRGADVLVTDQSPPDKLEASVAQLRPLIDAGQVTLRLGGHNVSDFTTCDLVVVNPAVPPGNRFVRAAEAAGIPVTTEIRLLVERLPNRLRTIGVTGSAGKSTVTAMIGHVLGKVFAGEGAGETGGESTPRRQGAKTPRREPRVWVGGNIGGSLLEQIDEIDSTDWVVLELSSFMLERLREQPGASGDAGTNFRGRGWSPHIAVVTNISENHLDWHGSMADYVAAKQVITTYQVPGDVAILHESVGQMNVRDGVDRQAVQQEGSVIPWLRVVGKHNSQNAKFAAVVGETICLGHGHQVLQSLADFPGLPHRLEFVGEFDGVRYYNDSKCTTPAAARLAVEAFVEGDDRSVEVPGVHLILGGYDKGSDLAELAAFARGVCKGVYTIGATGEAVARGVETAAEAASAGVWGTTPGAIPGAGAEVVRSGTLERAVDEIRGRVVAGDVVLLSPGCASWDQFENYEQRGARFIELVRAGRGDD